MMKLHALAFVALLVAVPSAVHAARVLAQGALLQCSFSAFLHSCAGPQRLSLSEILLQPPKIVKGHTTGRRSAQESHGCCTCMCRMHSRLAEVHGQPYLLWGDEVLPAGQLLGSVPP